MGMWSPSTRPPAAKRTTACWTLCQTPGMRSATFEARTASQQEIQEFGAQLASFGISFSDVADNCPRQERTLAACRRVLDCARANPALLEKLVETGRLPMSELAAGSGTDKKTMERHRKYLVAILLAFTNGYEIIRGHLCQIDPGKGRGGKMSYLVMETHPAYAVVLDEEGRFLKAANLRYQVGDTVQDIVELQMPGRQGYPPCGSPCPAWRALPPASAWCSLGTTGPTSPPTAPCASRSTRMWR